MSLAEDVLYLDASLNSFITSLSLKKENTTMIDKFCSLEVEDSLAFIIHSFCTNSKKDIDDSGMQSEKEKDAPYDKHKLFFKDTSWDNGAWDQNVKQVCIDTNEFLDIRNYYVGLFDGLAKKQFRNCLKYINILCLKNFNGKFLGESINLSKQFKEIKEKFSSSMEKLKEEKEEKRKQKIKSAQALKDLKNLKEHLEAAQNSSDTEKFLDSIDDAYDELCSLAELDIDLQKNKNPKKGLAKWYGDYSPKKTKDKDDKIEAILAIGKPQYITKSFFGLFDTSKRLRLVRKYLPKIEQKWKEFQKQDKKKK